MQICLWDLRFCVPTHTYSSLYCIVFLYFCNRENKMLQAQWLMYFTLLLGAIWQHLGTNGSCWFHHRQNLALHSHNIVRFTMNSFFKKIKINAAEQEISFSLVHAFFFLGVNWCLHYPECHFTSDHLVWDSGVLCY